MTQTQVKTQSVTNTQLAVAVLAAFMAGGLAFAAAPAGNENNSGVCGVQSLNSVRECKKGKFLSMSYTCVDGTEGTIEKRKCADSYKFMNTAVKICAKLQCIEEEKTENVSETQNQYPNLVISQIDIDSQSRNAKVLLYNTGKLSSEPLSSNDEGVVVEWKSSDGEKFITTESLPSLESGQRIQLDIDFPTAFFPNKVSVEVDGKNKIKEEDESNSLSANIQNVNPFVVFSDDKIVVSGSGHKKQLFIFLENQGSDFLNDSAKYKLEILGEGFSPIETYDLEFGTIIKGFDKAVLQTTLPAPEGAQFVRITLPGELNPANVEQIETISLQ